ncbi:MAG: alginate O-acetyltransferase [Limisphaerales bacterium]
MNPIAHITSPRKPWAEWLLIFVFATLLWLPTLDFFCDIDPTDPAGENRLPAPEPRLTQLNVSGIKHFLAASELYFNDHFGFRNRLIRWFQQWKLRLFHDPSVRKAILGQNGWLFRGEEQMVEHYLGIAKFTPEQLKSWQTLLEKRRDWLAQRGIKYLFVIAPDKQTIYSEELPIWLLNAAPTNRETKLDQFLQYMNAHSTVEILDLRQPLISAKTTAPTYLQNDTHWNSFGSFIACQELIKTLAKQFPDLPPLRLQDFTWTNAAYNGGDLTQMLGLDQQEKNYFVFQPGPTLPSLQITENPAYKSNWGIKRVSTVENAATRQGKLVLFNDSFGGSWIPWLGQSFQRTVLEWESRDFNTPLISTNAPDVVINEMLECFFYIRDPQEILTKDALP